MIRDSKGWYDKRAEEALGTPDTDRLTILLAHNPRYKKSIFLGSIDDISGHYHGGVMMLGKSGEQSHLIFGSFRVNVEGCIRKTDVQLLSVQVWENIRSR